MGSGSSMHNDTFAQSLDSPIFGGSEMEGRFTSMSLGSMGSMESMGAMGAMGSMMNGRNSRISDWDMNDEMNQTSQYLPPLAELDLSSTTNGGEFFSPFAPAVESVDVIKNLDYEKDLLTQMMEDEDEEDLGPKTKDNNEDDEDDDIEVDTEGNELSPETRNDIQDEEFIHEMQHNKEMSKMLQKVPENEKTIVLQPATPRNTMHFGGSGFMRGDNPLLRQTRLWSFHHTPGARVHEGTMTPYTLPNGQQVYLYKKQRMHFADLPWVLPPHPEPITPSLPPSLSLPTATRFGPVVRRAVITNVQTDKVKKNQIDQIKMNIIEDVPLELQIIERIIKDKKRAIRSVSLSSTFAATRLMPINLLDISFEHCFNGVKSNNAVINFVNNFVAKNKNGENNENKENDENDENIDVIITWNWCRKILRCVYPILHQMWATYVLVVHDGKVLRDGIDKIIRWFTNCCGLVSNEKEDDGSMINLINQVMGENIDIVPSCSEFMACILVAASTKYASNNMDLFTRLGMTLSNIILPNFMNKDNKKESTEEEESNAVEGKNGETKSKNTEEKKSNNQNGIEQKKENETNSNIYLTNMYRKTHLTMPTSSFHVALYSEQIEQLLLPHLKELKNWYSMSCSASSDVVEKIVVVKEEKKEEKGGKSSKTRGATKTSTTTTTKNVEHSKHKKHKKPAHQHHRSTKKKSKRMAIGDWLACLKQYHLIPSKLGVSELKNENDARKCFVKSLQPVENNSPQNAITLSFIDFVECIVWYSCKGNVILPTATELHEAGHSDTGEGMLHYLEKKKIECEINFVGENAEPFPNPVDHNAWIGDNVNGEREFGQEETNMKYKLEMFLCVLMERIETTKMIMSGGKKKKKKKV